jgi:hypothetical protein
VPTSNCGNVSVISTINGGTSVKFHTMLQFPWKFEQNFFGDYQTTLNLFASIRSGRPFSYTFDTGSSSIICLVTAEETKITLIVHIAVGE